MNLELVRDTFGDTFTLGKLYADGVKLGETCEDKDRHLEAGGEKVYGQSAIPRGRYAVSVTYSNRFRRPMPIIHDVPGFSGVRIHGGNSDADTLGCPLLGGLRTARGVARCAAPNAWLISLIEAAEERGEPVWLEVT